MNKTFFRLTFTLGLAFIATSCFNNGSLGPSSDSNNNGNDGGGTTPIYTYPTYPGGGSTPPVNSYPGTGSTCQGNANDGQGAGAVINQYPILLAGGQTWSVYNGSNALAQSTMMPSLEASFFYKTDSRLRIRVKVHDQPITDQYSGEYCYGRLPIAGDANSYSKLRMRFNLRDLICNNYDTSGNCVNFSLGAPYAYRYMDPVDVGNCSDIVDFGSLKHNNVYGVIVEVSDVKTDISCQFNGYYCPSELTMHAGSCYRMTLQAVTDYTQDFR